MIAAAHTTYTAGLYAVVSLGILAALALVALVLAVRDRGEARSGDRRDGVVVRRGPSPRRRGKRNARDGVGRSSLLVSQPGVVSSVTSSPRRDADGPDVPASSMTSSSPTPPATPPDVSPDACPGAHVRAGGPPRTS